MPDVLIFDDDVSIGNLVGDLLHHKGLTMGYYASGAGVVQMVLDARPRLLILDVMMPGMDGLSACRAIRSNPATRQVKILMLTAKSFQQDRTMAKNYGADAFLSKPFQISELNRTIDGLLSLPPQPLAGDEKGRPPEPPAALTLLPAGAVLEMPKLWVVFDAGEGLNKWILAQKFFPPECWVCLSRYQPSATKEFEALGTLLARGCRVKMTGPDDPEGSLQRLAPRLTSQSGVKSTPLLYPQREAEFQLATGVQGRAQYTQHPGQTLAYQVLVRGKKIVYCPAHEVNPDPGFWRGHEMDKFRAFFSKAAVLLHGYRRSQENSLPDDGFGRGAWEPVVDLAAESKVRMLVLTPLPGALAVPGGLDSGLANRIRDKKLTLNAASGKPWQIFFL